MKAISIDVYRTTDQTYYAIERQAERDATKSQPSAVQFVFTAGRFVGLDEDEREAVALLRRDARAEARRRKIPFVHGLDV